MSPWRGIRLPASPGRTKSGRCPNWFATKGGTSIATANLLLACDMKGVVEAVFLQFVRHARLHFATQPLTPASLLPKWMVTNESAMGHFTVEFAMATFYYENNSDGRTENVGKQSEEPAFSGKQADRV